MINRSYPNCNANTHRSLQVPNELTHMKTSIHPHVPVGVIGQTPASGQPVPVRYRRSIIPMWETLHLYKRRFPMACTPTLIPRLRARSALGATLYSIPRTTLLNFGITCSLTERFSSADIGPSIPGLRNLRDTSGKPLLEEPFSRECDVRVFFG